MSSEECCGVSAADCESAGTDTVEVVDLSGLCDETGRYISAPPVKTQVWRVAEWHDGRSEFVYPFVVYAEPRFCHRTNQVLVSISKHSGARSSVVVLSAEPLYRDYLSAMRAAHDVALRIVDAIYEKIEAAG